MDVNGVAMSDQEFSFFGALVAQVVATLFVAAMVVDGFVKARSSRQVWVRIVFTLAMGIGLFAGLYAAAGTGHNSLVAILMVMGVGASLGAVVSAPIDVWTKTLDPGQGRTQAAVQIGLVVFFLIVPSLFVLSALS